MKILLSFTTLLPTLAVAQTFNTSYMTSFIDGLIGVIQYAVPLFVALALLVFAWGLVMFIRGSGDEGAHEEGRRKMVWGIVALFVIVSVWGLVALLRSVVGFGTTDPLVAPPQASFQGGSSSGGSGGGGGSTPLCGNPPLPACTLCDCDPSPDLPDCTPGCSFSLP